MTVISSMKWILVVGIVVGIYDVNANQENWTELVHNKILLLLLSRSQSLTESSFSGGGEMSIVDVLEKMCMNLVSWLVSVKSQDSQIAAEDNNNMLFFSFLWGLLFTPCLLISYFSTFLHNSSKEHDDDHHLSTCKIACVLFCQMCALCWYTSMKE